MTSKRRQIKLGAMIHGVGSSVSAWRHPDVRPDASITFDFYRREALIAEAGKLDLVFIADVLHINENSTPHFVNHLEPLTLLSALGVATSHIGLVGTLSTTYSDPYTSARQLASIDHISGGRAGWNVVTTGMSAAALNFGKSEAEHPGHDQRYRMAAEYLNVARGLWDSWEDDAFVRDKESGVFFDADKLHTLNHRGEFCAVKGPLNISRSRQGQPVIFQAGSSTDGQNFSAVHADAVMPGITNLEEARRYYKELKRKAGKAGRDPDQLIVMPSASIVVGRTREEAEEKYAKLASLKTFEQALKYFAQFFDFYDFTQYPLDGPFPDVGELGRKSFQSFTDRVKREARERGLTLRQTVLQFSGSKPEFFGSPEEVADRMQEWFETGAADGFILHSDVPGTLADVTELVVPILQQRGLFRIDYESDTLRGNLGLKVPVNRYERG
ncbi:LLM class flavin-dependent oxidoreductase [Paenibacillus radicis (ex Gao et al. 2016)]|uniref:Monooxygenase n=1 Tax=Paenibacillus radicis (ex Gao et al. 2016) TaxID=1737354 RepID=A0A917GXH3_9BACL|nr:LLM class flavin-dependent oxidoreductase [Paenibacillus radicis (ex Gao et al. 2016)]GGG60462.1 monooxygenase [Paenibacillus radicis (ex Gao et al. 2016)]